MKYTSYYEIGENIEKSNKRISYKFKNDSTGVSRKG